MICSLCGEYIDPNDDSCYCDKLRIGDDIFCNPQISNKVVHPSHYNWIPGIECMDVVKHFDFPVGNVMKYCWRAGYKTTSTKLEDLEKAKYNLEIAIEMEKEKCNSGT